MLNWSSLPNLCCSEFGVYVWGMTWSEHRYSMCIHIINLFSVSRLTEGSSVYSTNWSKIVFQRLYRFRCNIHCIRQTVRGLGDYFYLQVFDVRICKVFFLFVCQAPESFIFHWQRFPFLLSAYIIKCAILSTDFLPEFAFLLYPGCLFTPLCCDHHPYCEPVQHQQLLLSLRKMQRSECEHYRTGDECVTNHTFNEPFCFIFWSKHDPLRTGPFDTLRLGFVAPKNDKLRERQLLSLTSLAYQHAVWAT